MPKLEMIGLLDIKGQDSVRRVYDPDGLAPTLTTCGGGCRQVKILDKKTIQSQKANPNGIRTPAGVSYGALGAGSLRLSGL